jgi:hypothetical protein
MIRSLVELPVPESYFEWITRYGCPEFDSLDDPCCFKYSYREPELSMEFEGAISHFMVPQRVSQYYSALVLDENEEDVPKFPPFMLPIGLDYGQSHVLLECGGPSDRIWFWEFQADPWGQGNNVRLGFVAPTLSAFLQALYVQVDT